MKDLTGQKFSRLTAIQYIDKAKSGHARWLYRCDCGTEKILSSNPVTQGKTCSCGCLDREKHLTNPNRRTHGEHGTRLYRIWKAMKTRCTNPNSEDYQKYYGSKGVQICSEWKLNYWIFVIGQFATVIKIIFRLTELTLSGIMNHRIVDGQPR